MEGDEGIFSKAPDFRGPKLQLRGGGFEFLPFYPHVCKLGNSI